MSSFSDPKYKSDEYNSFRPVYPNQFLSHILKYTQDHIKSSKSESKPLRILDIGSGPGTAIRSLLPLLPNDISIHIILTDISATMMNEAREKLADIGGNITLEFITTSNETLLTHVKDPVDLILAAECVHWFNFPMFIENCSRLLNAGGTLAYWIYVDSIFIDYPKSDLLNKWYEEFSYEDPCYLQKYWQGSKDIARTLLREYNDSLLSKEGKDWEDVSVGYLVNNQFEAGGNTQWAQNLLIMEDHSSINDIGRYIDTWSSSNKWNSTHEERAGEVFVNYLKSVGINEEEVVKWQMKSGYLLASKM